MTRWASSSDVTVGTVKSLPITGYLAVDEIEKEVSVQFTGRYPKEDA
jgi:hypothetical protein